MIPRSLTSKLGELRRRETFLRFTWGAARLLAVVLSLLILACLIDWALDEEADTPWLVRVALTFVQAVVAIVAAWYFVVKPLTRRLDDSSLALWVEERTPALEHRLISAVQLNQPGAVTQGMSRELIGEVTREAERQTERIDFAGLADHRRLKWSLLAAGPVVLLGLVLLALWPQLSLALLARQFLADREIPRSITLASLTPEVLPSGEKVKLRFKASGKDVDKAAGYVTVRPDDSFADQYPLVLGTMKEGERYFEAAMPAMSSDFSYRAWLGDGRLPRTQRVRFVPRPVVLDLEARVMLPAYCGVKPDGARYERSQPRGEVVGIPGSTAKILVTIQKPIKTGVIESLFSGEPKATIPGDEQVRRTVAMSIDETGKHAEGTFDLKPDETAYRVIVKDEHGFENMPPPRRTLRIIPEDPPQVALLREQALFPPKLLLTGQPLVEEVDLEGMPVPVGRPIRIGYSCTGPYGLGHTRLLYRVLAKNESGNEGGDEKWQILPLPEVKSPKNAGSFLPQFGVFEKSGPRDQVPFHAVPSSDPEHVLGRIVGGGRLNFQTTELVDPKGAPLNLKEGDQIEYCVEVFADRDAKSGRPFARSETRVKTIVSVEDFARWRYELSQEQERLNKLEAKQTGVFSSGK